MNNSREKQTIGGRIRMYRTKAGLSQQALAKLAHIRQGTLSDIESNRVENPGSRTLRRIARALGTTVGALVD